MAVTSSKQIQYPAEKHCIIISSMSRNGVGASYADSKDGEKVAIVIPTLNERENIIKLVPQIEDVFKEHRINGHIIIVDDHSKDGTGAAAKDLARTYRNIMVIQRPGKLGLGSAYRCGFKHALQMNMDIIMEMDADLSHRPEYIPEFLKALKTSDAGLVIGSRYIEHGSSKDWPLQRKMISFSANLVTKMILGLSNVQDKTSGFRAYRAQVLRDIDFDSMVTNGYAFQIEILHRTELAGYKVKEIPIVFYEREIGESKLSRKDVKEYAIFLLVRSSLERIKRLLSGDLNKFIKFCIVGFVGFLLVLGIGYLTKYFTQDYLTYVITNAIATVLAMVFNFTFNKIWSFRDKQKAFKRQLSTDLGGRFISFGLNELIVIPFAAQHWFIATLAGVVMQVLFNFAWNRYLVFRKLNPVPTIKARAKA